MTEKLKEAVARVNQLPEEQQDAIAALIMEEIEDEARWDTSFARSQRETPNREELYARAASAIGRFQDRQGATDVSRRHDDYLDEALS